MSYTELHTGKLKPIGKISLQELQAWVETKPNLEIEDFEEKMEDEYEYFEIRDKTKKYKEPFYIKYIWNKGTLYEILEHSGEQEADFLDLTNQNSDGTINFTYLFYNGGTCFSEMLEEGLNKINKGKENV